MKVAVTYANGEVFQHFGHTEQFKVYEIADGKILSSEVIGTEGAGHSSLAGFLKNKGVEILICGGMGGGAKMALTAQGIEFYPGVSGNADMAVEAFLRKELQYDANTECNHHGEGEHQCGGHHHHEGGYCGKHDHK